MVNDVSSTNDLHTKADIEQSPGSPGPLLRDNAASLLLERVLVLGDALDQGVFGRLLLNESNDFWGCC